MAEYATVYIQGVQHPVTVYTDDLSACIEIDYAGVTVVPPRAWFYVRNGLRLSKKCERLFSDMAGDCKALRDGDGGF